MNKTKLSLQKNHIISAFSTPLRENPGQRTIINNIRDYYFADPV